MHPQFNSNSGATLSPPGYSPESAGVGLPSISPRTLISQGIAYLQALFGRVGGEINGHTNSRKLQQGRRRQPVNYVLSLPPFTEGQMFERANPLRYSCVGSWREGGDTGTREKTMAPWRFPSQL